VSLDGGGWWRWGWIVNLGLELTGLLLYRIAVHDVAGFFQPQTPIEFGRLKQQLMLLTQFLKVDFPIPKFLIEYFQFLNILR
jgi:hypothetical protein